ncbi:organic solute transporter Ostalpha-domain-containing protein [Usnea florida]
MPTKLNLGSLSNDFAGANITQVVGISEIECVLEPYFTAVERYSSGYTYHEIILIISAVTTTLCLIFTVSLMTVHLSNWVKPQEQKQIVRIVFFPTIFSFFNFFAVWFYQRSWILLPFPELYECFALVAMFYLLVVYVTPHDATRESHFQHLQRLHYWGKKPKHDRGSLRWFRFLWVGVFQVLPLKLVVNLLEWILSAVQCPLKYQLGHTSLAITIVQSLSTTVCIACVIEFARRIGTGLRGTKTRAKLISFKGIVGVSLTQTPVFVGFASYGVFHRTKTVSVLDFTVGTPAFMTCCEMFIISVVFIWTFTAEPYLNMMGSMPRCRSVGGALLEVLDIRDILKGFWYMTKIIFCSAGRPPAVEQLEKGPESDTHELTEHRHSETNGKP